MITLTVASFNGGPLAQPIVATFDELGGTIGRADNNQLVLPDPERTISRVHAQVVFRNGRFAIVDRGSNPISVNNRPLGNGHEAPINAGDTVQIGGYALKVEAAKASGAVDLDPFADFGGLAAPAPAPASAPAARGAPAVGADPMAAFGFNGGGGSGGGAAALFGASPSPAPSGGGLFGGGTPAAASPAAGGIPDDWDPFAPEPAAKPSAADPFARAGGGGNLGLEVGGRGTAPLIPDMPGGRPAGAGADSIDNLFGLGPASASSSGDPFANSPLQAASALPNMAAHDDPMKSLGSLTQASGASARDQLSELNAPFNLPPMNAAPAAPPAALPADLFLDMPGAPSAPPPPAPAGAAPKGAVLSWDAPSQESRTIIRPKAGAAAPATPPSVAAAPPAAPARPALAASPTSTPRAAPMNADTQALLTAFREGLGMPQLPIDSLTPEFMRLLGQLIAESTRGTVELLVARAALKREIRAEVTMIVARENNPLKFSPSAEVAMNHLLSPPARGFMPADRAMRDAYDDLRAHQFGFLAGLRAALEGVLQRFDPAELEGKLTRKSRLSSLLPGSRKAQMWDVFQELYGQISAEAQDDFHELFGKAFVRAYEAHIDQLKKDAP